jgi:lipopolysaccharide export system protein LptC
MKEKFSIVFSLAILITLVMGTWWAADYAQRAVDIDPPSKNTHEFDNWAKNPVIIRTNPEGHVITRIEGDRMEHFPDDGSYEVETPRAFSLRPENPLTVATAKAATIFDEGDKIVMKGDAVLMRLGDAEHQPLNFRSEVITILVKEDLSFTDLPAVAVNGRSRLRGIGMLYNNATREIDVFKSSDMDIAPKDQKDDPQGRSQPAASKSKKP